jgi:hypothetical protein
MKKLVLIISLMGLTDLTSAQVADLKYRDRDWKCIHCSNAKSSRTLVEIVNVISGDRSRLEALLLLGGHFSNTEPSAKSDYCNNLNWSYCEFKMVSEKTVLVRRSYADNQTEKPISGESFGGPAIIQVKQDKFGDAGREAQEDFERFFNLQMEESKKNQGQY